jgi:hypothetical protein
MVAQATPASWNRGAVFVSAVPRKTVTSAQRLTRDSGFILDWLKFVKGRNAE